MVGDLELIWLGHINFVAEWTFNFIVLTFYDDSIGKDQYKHFLPNIFSPKLKYKRQLSVLSLAFIAFLSRDDWPHVSQHIAACM